MRVMGAGETRQFNGRSHFMRLAARAMRNVLVDHARHVRSSKRNYGEPALALDEALDAFAEQALDVVELDDTLERLGEVDEHLARLVELRFFAGMTLDETARALGVSASTIVREWRTTRAWLQQALDHPEPPAGEGEPGDIHGS
jgi:RNA polymerase sigma factor (TIGR02999 family)